MAPAGTADFDSAAALFLATAVESADRLARNSLSCHQMEQTINWLEGALGWKAQNQGREAQEADVYLDGP